MATQYGSIALFLIFAVSYFFAHDQNYGWNCSRDWLPRPDFDTEAIEEYVDKYNEVSEQAGNYLYALLPYLAYVLFLKITWENIALVYRRYKYDRYLVDWNNIDLDH